MTQMVVVLLTAASSFAVAQDWSQFRGPNGNGLSEATGIPASWSEEENVSWKTEIPGRGWSSPVMAEDQIWLTTAIETKATGAKAEEMLKSARIGGLVPFTEVELRAICIDRHTGKVQYNVDLFQMADPPLINSMNSFASPTPVVKGERVFVNFGAYGTACLDRKSGAVVWKNRNNQLKHETGPGSSPVLVDDLLILHCDGIDLQYVVALDAESGDNVWKTERTGQLNPSDSMKKTFTTPAITQIDGKKRLISPGADWVYVYDPSTGEELSRLSYGEATGFSAAPVPLIDGENAIICTGFMKSVLMSMRISSGAATPEIAWKFKSQVPTMSSPILVDGHVYMVSDRGIMTCVDAVSGEKVWQERLSGKFSSSPIFVDGKLIVGNDQGVSYVIKPGGKFELISENRLDSAIMATPAAVENQLYIRTRNSLYRIEK